MLACLFSVRLLRQQGFEEYAAQTSREYRDEAEECPLEMVLGADLWKLSSYPVGLYGRVYVTGCALKSAVGWAALCRLARFRVKQGAPDFGSWLSSLPEDKKPLALRVMDGRG